MDFTLKTYRSLLSALRRAGYTFRTFEEFLSVPADGKVVILRHDIDKRPENALRLAQIEHASGVIPGSLLLSGIILFCFKAAYPFLKIHAFPVMQNSQP